MIRKLQTAAYWTIPSLFCLILYWPGLLAWFQQDDFAFLNLINQAPGDGLLYTLFHPNVQGTWRPLSERVFFLAFGAMFGSDALPYHIWVFVTMFANLVLIQSLAVRLTRSRAAGFLAAILWISNSVLATALSWTCAYNLVACAFFLLLALHLFLTYTQTNQRRFYLLTWAVFLTGFLAMETNVVFPLLAITYAILCARRYLLPALCYLPASAIYAGLHLKFAPNQGTLAYTAHIDTAIPATLWTYWRFALEPAAYTHLRPRAATIEMAACTLALLAFAALQARRKQWLPLVFLAWFVILLGPVLPLRDHVIDYYLALPTLALSLAAGYAVAHAWRAGLAWRIIGAALTLVFIYSQLPVARAMAAWYRWRGAQQEQLVMGVQRAHELHPGKVILIDGVDDTLFWGGIQQRPFLFLRIRDVYLAPGSERSITPHPELDDLSKFILPPDETRRALDRDQAVVYRSGSGPLQNITHQFQVPAFASADLPVRLDIGDPLAADRLGPTWYPLEPGFRWMPRQATVSLPGPRAPGQKLYVTANCPEAQLSKGPLEMTITIDGIRSSPVQFTRKGDATFTFPLPPQTMNKSEIEVTIDLNRTTRAGADPRDLGLAFGTFEIR